MSSVNTQQSALRLQQLRARARHYRHNPTASEHVLFQAIRGKRLGVEFRRQVVVGNFIVDFLARSIRLILEVDGGYHTERVRLDARRQRKLELAGHTVLRFTDEDVMRRLPEVLAELRGSVERLQPHWREERDLDYKRTTPS